MPNPEAPIIDIPHSYLPESPHKTPEPPIFPNPFSSKGGKEVGKFKPWVPITGKKPFAA